MALSFRKMVSGMIAGLLGASSPVVLAVPASAIEQKEAQTEDDLLVSISREFLGNSKFLKSLGVEASQMDYSIESLRQVDVALQKLHDGLPDGADGKDLSAVGDEQVQFVTLGLGSYVGEVLRRNLTQGAKWEGFESLSDEEKELFGSELNLGNAYFIRWPNGVTFPLSKVLKFLTNGSEDSVYYYAQIILKEPVKVSGDGSKTSH